MSDDVHGGDEVVQVFTSEILQLFVSVRERPLPSFHLVVCFFYGGQRLVGQGLINQDAVVC